MVASITLIWITAAVVLALLILSSIIFVTIYRDHRERDAFVTFVCVLALTSLLATVCLLPVDIALTSTTTNNSTGLKKDWADEKMMHNILLGLKVVYYTLFSLDAVMCLLVIPFAYFWYEEYEPGATTGDRVKGALKYSVFFLAILVVLLLVGLFVPVARETKGHLDLDYFKRLLTENNGERALTFILGVLICVGTVVYIIYTGAGLALMPMVMIKSAPVASIPALASSVHEQLAVNHERQRAIEVRYAGTNEGPNSKDRRELESLQREELTLKRRQRIAEENSKGARKFLRKLEAIGRPFKILLGLFLLGVSLLLFASFLITGIDKAKNSVCGKHCGYILPRNNILNPVNWVFVQSSKVFPVDYILALLLVFDFFISTVVGIAFIGIRFLWVTLFRLRSGGTKPQGLLLSTILLMLCVLAMNYSITMVLAPQYAHYGGQKFCDHVLAGVYRSCKHNKDLIRPCDENSPQDICTPTVVSQFINRVTLNFPFFGIFSFWAQFAFLGVFLITLVTGLICTPRLGSRSEEDEAAEAEEEESLLATTGRRFGSAWEDLTGRAAKASRRQEGYGSTSNGRNGEEA